ncbi:hypothetical protein ABIA32_004875 [Streptacidiphilus sp. MAP12-20]|uniref:hypothetical protein n=1 Tax=Streptacidiphilus sp. MAP12-20 TaxID=3156299 RepID=UPI003514FA67
MAFARTRGAVRLGAVAAAVVISGGLTALPAGASGGSVLGVVLSSPQVTLLPQSSGAPAQTFHPLTVNVVNAGPSATGVKVNVDASRAAGLVELSLPKNCAFTDAAKLHASCALGSVDLIGVLTFGMRSAPGVAAGARGSVVVTATAADAALDPIEPKSDLSTAVVIGDGPDLAARPLPAVLSVTKQQGTAVNPTVVNVGDRDATGGVMLYLGAMGDDYRVGGSSGNYSNCAYGVTSGQPGDTGAGVVCRFDTVVKPGQAYRLSADVPVTAGPIVTGPGELLYAWDVKGGPIDSTFGGGKAGTGAALTLVPVASPAVQPRTLDINYDNNVGMSELRLITKDDVAAVAHDVHGTVGRPVTASFGVRNAGLVPTRALEGDPKVTAAIAVILPKGVSVASAPTGCVDGTKAGGASTRSPAFQRAQARALASSGGRVIDPSAVYVCAVTRVLQPGQEADFAFRLKPTSRLNAAEGLVVAIGQPADNTPDNNLAVFKVTATIASSATPTASASPTHPASASASAAPGGGLAHTGGGSDALPLVAAGAAAIALGAGAVALTRRRRSGAGSHS